jgi:hypothetical protein
MDGELALWETSVAGRTHLALRCHGHIAWNQSESDARIRNIAGA